MKKIAVIGVFLGMLVTVPPASARYLSYSAAYRAVYWDVQQGQSEVPGRQGTEINACTRISYGRLHCPARIYENDLYEVIRGHYDENGVYQPIQFIYFHYYCQWTSAAHWRGRQVVATRLGLNCDEWFDENVGQE
jgi:hypothetical protein